jgi:hypothetical protein
LAVDRRPINHDTGRPWGRFRKGLRLEVPRCAGLVGNGPRFEAGRPPAGLRFLVAQRCPHDACRCSPPSRQDTLGKSYPTALARSRVRQALAQLRCHAVTAFVLGHLQLHSWPVPPPHVYPSPVTRRSRPPAQGHDWLHEPKWDGFCLPPLLEEQSPAPVRAPVANAAPVAALNEDPAPPKKL